MKIINFANLRKKKKKLYICLRKSENVHISSDIERTKGIGKKKIIQLCRCQRQDIGQYYWVHHNVSHMLLPYQVAFIILR